MIVGNLYIINETYDFDDESDIFVLIRLENKPPEKGVNPEWLPIGYLRNLKTGEQLKINHPENLFEPLGDSK